MGATKSIRVRREVATRTGGAQPRAEELGDL